jgi:hypothetical protein
MAALKAAAGRHCGGRLVALHEGGYSDVYVPFCGLAAIEEMAGVRSKVGRSLVWWSRGAGWLDLCRSASGHGEPQPPDRPSNRPTDQPTAPTENTQPKQTTETTDRPPGSRPLPPRRGRLWLAGPAAAPGRGDSPLRGGGAAAGAARRGARGGGGRGGGRWWERRRRRGRQRRGGAGARRGAAVAACGHVSVAVGGERIGRFICVSLSLFVSLLLLDRFRPGLVISVCTEVSHAAVAVLNHRRALQRAPLAGRVLFCRSVSWNSRPCSRASM